MNSGEFIANIENLKDVQSLSQDRYATKVFEFH